MHIRYNYNRYNVKTIVSLFSLCICLHSGVSAYPSLQEVFAEVTEPLSVSYRIAGNFRGGGGKFFWILGFVVTRSKKLWSGQV